MTESEAMSVRAARGRQDLGPLRILVIADAKIPVPPVGYGGTERIVALLCRGLAARGHRVTLIAAKGSRNYGRLATHPWPGRKPYPYRAWCKIRFQAQSLWHARGADVVINFGRVDYLWSLLKTTTPIICQFQNPVEDSADRIPSFATYRGPLVRERQRSPARSHCRCRLLAYDLQCRGYRSACVRASS